MAVPVHVDTTEREHYKQVIEEDPVSLVQRHLQLGYQLSFAPRLCELIFSQHDKIA